MGKETTPDYKIIWAMKLEKERLTNLKGSKLFRASPGLPEIDLINARNMRNDIKPVVVRYPNPELHRLISGSQH